jgi:hypothetical protein
LWQRFGGELVGVATGPASQIAVLDIDAKHHPAHAWWQANRARLLPTRVHRTRSGGLHLIFRDADGLKCSAGRIASGIDTRSTGGYAIWWPAAGLPVLCDAPIALWPEWLREALAPPTAPIRIPPSRSARSALAFSVEARIEGIFRFVFDAPVGERNARLYWAACRLTEMVHGDDLDSSGGNQALEELRQIANPLGLSDREIILTINSATRGKT